MMISATEAATSTAIVTYWIGEDGQGDFDMTGLTAAEAVTELLGQCGEESQRTAIMAGHFIVAEG